MKKLLAIFLILSMVLVMGLHLSMSSAGASGAAREFLYKNPACDCTNGATPNGTTYGFVVLNTDASGRLIIVVSLKGAEPNTTYDLHIHQYPPGCPPTDIIPGAITTNKEGNGTANAIVTRQTDSINFWICVMHYMDMSQPHFVSPAVELK